MGLMFPKKVPRTVARAGGKDEAHLRLIRQCQCLACGTEPAEAAHIRYADPRYGKPNPGMARKPDDKWTVPLCPLCHRTGNEAQHSANERTWWEAHRIDPHAISQALHRISVTCRGRKLQAAMIVDLMRAEVRKARRRLSE